MMKQSHLITLLAITLADVLLGIAAFGSLPESVPVHWNIHGQVDRMGSPWELALVMPAVNVFLAGLLILLPAIKSVGVSIEPFRVTYGRIGIVAVTAFSLIHVATLLNALGWPIGVEKVIPCVCGIMILVLGNWMGKLRRNRLVGIRTPWTLANDTVWERTHRAGGPLMVLYGLAIVLTALASTPVVTFVVIMVGAVALIVWSFVHSRRIYHQLQHNGEIT